MTLVSITGIIASILTAVILIPQLVKILKEKKAEGVSIGMILITFFGLGLWICYGIQKNDMIITISNSFSFIVNIILGIFSIRYKTKNGDHNFGGEVDKGKT